jgi:hypothetical protein
MLVMFTNAYWAFSHFMTAQALNMTEAALWGKILSFWPFLDAYILHFALAFTESRLLKNKLIYLVLYLPALFFSLVDLTTNMIYSGTILQAWGYTNTITASVIGSLYGIWSGIFSLLSLFVFANYYNKVVDKTKKRQTEFMAAGFAIPVVVSLFTDSLFPALVLHFQLWDPSLAA